MHWRRENRGRACYIMNGIFLVFPQCLQSEDLTSAMDNFGLCDDAAELCACTVRILGFHVQSLNMETAKRKECVQKYAMRCLNVSSNIVTAWIVTQPKRASRKRDRCATLPCRSLHEKVQRHLDGLQHRFAWASLTRDFMVFDMNALEVLVLSRPVGIILVRHRATSLQSLSSHSLALPPRHKACSMNFLLLHSATQPLTVRTRSFGMTDTPKGRCHRSAGIHRPRRSRRNTSLARRPLRSIWQVSDGSTRPIDCFSAVRELT